MENGCVRVSSVYGGGGVYALQPIWQYSVGEALALGRTKV
jgi:hypothetical protein